MRNVTKTLFLLLLLITPYFQYSVKVYIYFYCTMQIVPSSACLSKVAAFGMSH